MGVHCRGDHKTVIFEPIIFNLRKLSQCFECFAQCSMLNAQCNENFLGVPWKRVYTRSVSKFVFSALILILHGDSNFLGPKYFICHSLVIGHNYGTGLRNRKNSSFPHLQLIFNITKLPRPTLFHKQPNFILHFKTLYWTPSWMRPKQPEQTVHP